MTKEEIISKAKAELLNAEGISRDSGMPVFEKTVITLFSAKAGETCFIAESNYKRWRTDGALLSTTQTGRRGNGLNLEGSNDAERNASLYAEVVEAGENGLKIMVSTIKQKKALFDGADTLNSYYFFERV